VDGEEDYATPLPLPEPMEEDLPKIKKQAVAGGMAQVVRVPA
jgi:hypothetical protein